jgi:hypothetical protein
MKKCIHCGTESDGKYCPECGQEMDIKRLEVKTIFHDVIHGILHWENSILKTFRALLSNPGGVAGSYISGLRKSYVRPFTYFIFIQTIYVLFFHWMSGKYFAFFDITVNNSGAVLEKDEQIQHLIDAYANYLNYFMPLFFALYFYLFYRKKTDVNYAESIALSFYLIGTTLVFGIVLMLLSLIDIRIWNARIIVNVIFLIFATLQFTKLPIFKGILKSLLVVFLSYITYGLFVGLILFIYLHLTANS